MSFCRLKSIVRTFLLLCLVAMMCQWMFLHGLNLDVKGEPTSTMYRSIDLYTQKEPYSGRGSNQPSDAFAPQEEVILYAYVTYRDDPVPGRIVAFEVHGPVNRFENLSFTRTAITDANGVANVSFRVTWPDGYPREAVFGVWNVVAVVDIAEVTVNDTLSFLVGWIVELVKVETADSNNVSRTSFMRDERTCFRLTVKNIAMTNKIATLILNVYDNLSVSLGQVVLMDEQITPGVTVLFLEENLLIPEGASLGTGVVYANAYTALPALGGVSWCPEVSTTFSIRKAIVHDVAVISVVPSANEVFPCQTVNISVVVRNEGNSSETFNVSCYYNSVLIGTLAVNNLPPQTEKALTFNWCICCIPPGNYTISAELNVVPGEIDIDNNRFVDGVVRINPWTPPPSVEYVLPRWFLAFLFLLAVIAGATFVVTVGFALWQMHKRKNQTSVAAPTNVSDSKLYKKHPLKATKTCNVCGREFPAVYTFCPYCFTYQGDESA